MNLLKNIKKISNTDFVRKIKTAKNGVVERQKKKDQKYQPKSKVERLKRQQYVCTDRLIAYGRPENDEINTI